MSAGREAELTTDGRWVGASLPRREDRRLLLGRGRFVDDMAGPGALHAAFVRSPFAAAGVEGIDLGPALRMPGVAGAFAAADLGRPSLLAVLEREEFVPTAMPLLAEGEVRHVGEPVAVVVAGDPYAAEDAAEAVEVEWAPRDASSPVHAGVPANCLVDLAMFEDERLEEILAAAHLVVEATFASGRLAALPIEGRACLARWDDRDGQVVVHAATQVPHLLRSAIAQALGTAEAGVRVIAPDVGGGFGLKCVAGREEIVVAALALRLRRAVAWTEDRRDNLTAAFHGHEQRYQVRAAFDEGGRILGLRAGVECDVGAYSVFPFTCAVEPLMAATELPGAYRVPAYAARGRGVASHKAPTAPYRGVSRPQIVLVMERLLEKAARALAIDPVEIRRRNLIGRDELPYTGPNGITYDEGSYREALDLAELRVVEGGWYAERDRLREDGRPAGVGFACFSERTGYGTATMGQRRMAITPGGDVAHVRMDPTGDVVVTSGTCGQGQGHETTFAQIVADRLGIHPDHVRLRQGDTDLAAYGWGTFGSRSIVIGGSAARRAADGVAAQLRRIAAHVLEADEADVVLAGGAAGVRGAPRRSVAVAELARLAHFQAHTLPEGCRSGLEARGAFDPPGTFSNACHAALVALDPGTGGVEVLRYLVVEDCGVVVNPAVVEGQVRGGVAQGIGAALYEQVVYDADGQPLTATLADYLAPTATDLCPIEILHLETPSRFSETGAKGMGEGGTIGAPATILNALNQALEPSGIAFDHIPVLPEQVLAALAGGADD